MKAFRNSLHSACAFAFLAALISCKHVEPAPEPCMTPPLKASKNDQELSLKIAGAFSGASGSLETTFKHNLDRDYGTFNDRQVEYYMFFRAIECYSGEKNNPTEQNLAKELAALLLKKIRRDFHLAGATPKLNPVDINIMSRTDVGQINLHKFQDYGF
jgi:hypothetical protein